MFTIWAKIAEQRIQEAQANGEFDDLPGKGKPQKLDDDSLVPEDLRIAYKILKNAGCAPPELQLKKEIVQIEDMLSGIKDEQEKYRQIKKLNYLITKLNMMRNTSINFEENQRYYGRVVDKISISTGKNGDGKK